MKEYWFINNIVVYTKQDFYLIEKIDKVMRQFKSSGLLNYWVLEQTKQGSKIPEASKTECMNFIQLKGTFEIFVCGSMLSTLFFFAEILYFNLKILGKKFKIDKNKKCEKYLK